MSYDIMNKKIECMFHALTNTIKNVANYLSLISNID